MNALTSKLLEKASILPTSSGCYLMKNKKAEIIYIGKAKNLKKRVLSYFNNSLKSPKTFALVSHIEDFDFILTNTDVEALVLENNLIKKHRPKYNIRLKDSSSYPYVLINRDKKFPTLEFVRRPKREKKFSIFGPFSSAFDLRELIKILKKSFGLRDCSDRDFFSRKYPCILYQMKHCSAPCVGKISEEEYMENLNFALSYFKGEYTKIFKVLNSKMLDKASKEEFEEASMIRDNIELLKNLKFQKNAEFNTDEDVDIVAISEQDQEIDMSIYLVRNGILIGHKNFDFFSSEGDAVEVSISKLIEYYSNSTDILPRTIIFSSDDNLELQDALNKILNTDIKVLPPTSKYKSLYNLTIANLEEVKRMRLEDESSRFKALSKLKELLNLANLPVRIECYDIAIWQGKSPTASEVVFIEGKPSKKDYRYYHLKERPEGNNDFEMLKEVILRRIKYGDLPDVFLIDGGIGQVNSVVKVLDEFEIKIPVIGIAKERKENKTVERLFIHNRMNPYILEKNRELMKLTTSMRDEAHRFSRKLHHNAEKKRIIPS